MSPTLGGQLRALIWLLLHQARRRSLRAGEGPRRAGAPVFVILIAVTGLYFLGFSYAVGMKIAELPHGRLSAIRLLVWALSGYTFGSAFIAHAPQVGRIRPILRSSFLDVVPILPSARVIVTWMQSGLLSLAPAVAMLGAIPSQARSARTLLVWLSLAVVGSATGSVLGQVCVAAARAFAPRMLGRAVAWFGIVLLILPVWMLVNATSLGPRLAEGSDPLLAVALALEGGGHGPRILLCYLLAMGGGLVGLWALERRGYDRDDQPVASRYRSDGLRPPARTELVLLWRAGQAKLHLLQCIAMSALLGAVSGGVALTARPGRARGPLSLIMAAIAAQAILFVSMSLFTVAGAATTRDLAARPFLSAQPITPAQTLSYKARALRILSLPMFVTLCVLAVLFLVRAPILGKAFAFTYVSRILMLGIGFFILCAVAPAVAFLTRGLGAQDVARQGMPSLLIATLLFLPLISIALVPSWPQALAALAVLAALGAEARRAGQRCVSWIDDPGLDVERDTPTWRALLALGGFFAVQGLASQAFVFTRLDDGLRMALVTLMSGVALVALSLRARPRPIIRSRSPLWDLLGFAAGAASGILALGFALAMKRWFGTSSEPSTDGQVARIAMAVAVVVIAPLCEELFFRGWLQAAIARELGPERRGLAIGLGALAFAGAHIGAAIAPQLLLGLVAGALFSRTGRLRPGMLAHAAHNGIDVLIGQTL